MLRSGGLLFSPLVDHASLFCVFNSRTAIAGAIIYWPFLVFFISASRYLLRTDDVTITSNLLFSFVHAISTEVPA